LAFYYFIRFTQTEDTCILALVISKRVVFCKEDFWLLLDLYFQFVFVEMTLNEGLSRPKISSLFKQRNPTARSAFMHAGTDVMIFKICPHIKIGVF
jgi:hypothetical protein